MAVEWNYDDVAAAYDARPAYALSAIDECFAAMPPMQNAPACDVGAGTGRLTIRLAERGLVVLAVEPSAAMRDRGRARTALYTAVRWVGAVAEALPLRAATVRLMSFGSSLNVVDAPRALHEAARVLAPGGRLLCIWNHRRLDDPLQARIEAAIHAHVPRFEYGSRRDDPVPVLAANGFFRVQRIEHATVHRLPIATWLRAWQSHLTLRRQAGAGFGHVLAAIADVIGGDAQDEMAIPYVTRIWVAERR